MKKILLIIGVLFTLNSFGSVIIVKIDGGASGVVYMKGTSNPNVEASNITTALSSMGLTLQYGYNYTDANGNNYIYINAGGGKWEEIRGDTTTTFADSIICKEYIAVMTQTGTLAPVASVTFNTLGFTPTWARSSTGLTTATNTGGFSTNVSATTSVNINGASAFAIGVDVVSGLPDFFTVYQYDNTATLTDGAKYVIDIKVCP